MRNLQSLFVSNGPSAVGRGVAKIVADAFRASDWTVQEEPIIGGVQPDLLASDPAGDRSYVVEIKSPGEAGHFADVAQVAAYRRAAQAALGREVGAILVIEGDASANTAEAARELGVTLVAADAAHPDGTAEALVNHLHA
jgi:Restriction endonuclease